MHGDVHVPNPCWIYGEQNCAFKPCPTQPFGRTAMVESPDKGREHNEVADIEVITLQGKRFKVTDVPWLQSQVLHFNG